MTSQLSYTVDIVFCIDVTGSMTPIIDNVKANALRFHEDLQTELAGKDKRVDTLRVRVVAYRDFLAGDTEPILESEFFVLPDEREKLSAFVNRLTATGGGDEPESGLEALALSINSNWTTKGDRRRHVIVVWTDASAHSLEKGASVVPETYRARIPATFNDLTDLWDEKQALLTDASKRLVLFAPDAAGWTEVSTHWANAIHHTSRAGDGLAEHDYKSILEMIAASV